MKRTIKPLLVTLAVILLCVGCMSGGSSPVEGFITRANPDRGISHRVSWGMWDVTIDRVTGEVETVPLRGLDFESNVVMFLQPPKAAVNLLIKEINPDGTNLPEGRVSVDVHIEHPFPGTLFCGFDVMGIVMDDYPSEILGSDPEITVSLPPETLMINPDGYTRWWNQVEFTTYGKIFGYQEGSFAHPGFNCVHTLNPFKYFSDDTGLDGPFDPEPSSRGFFSSFDPGWNARRYELQFPVESGSPVFHFKYAVAASWVKPYNESLPPFTPGDYPLTANMPEPYKIEVINDGSDAFYVDDTDFGGNLNLLIEVRDWQYSGALSMVGEEIEAVYVESPTLFSGVVEIDISTAVEVPGNATGVRFPVLIGNVTPDALDNQMLIVTVQSADPTTYEPQIPGVTGFEFPDGHLAAYNIYEVPILPFHIGPPDFMQFAYSSNREGNYEVYLTDTDGTFETNLTNDPGVDYMCDWSPDGNTVYFNSNRDGDWDVYALDLVSDELVNVTNDDETQYDCSIDNSGEFMLTVQSWSVVDKDIFMLKTDGSYLPSDWVNLTDTPGIREDEMDWSPDDASIIYCSDITGSNNVWMMTSTGSDKHMIIDCQNDIGSHYPEYHPGGDYIAYNKTKFLSISAGLFYYTFAGDTSYPYIDDTDFDEYWARFNENGDYVIYAAREPGDIYYASFPEVQPGEPYQLIESPGDACRPVWRPSGGNAFFQIIELDNSYKIWMTDCLFNENDQPVVAMVSGEGGAMYHFFEFNGTSWDHTSPFGYGDTGANCPIRMCYNPDWDLAVAWPNIHWNGADRDSDFIVRHNGETTWDYSHIDTAYCGGYFNVIDHDGVNYAVAYNVDDAKLWYAYGQPGDWATEEVGDMIGNSNVDFALDSYGNPYVVGVEHWMAYDDFVLWYNTSGTWESITLVSEGAQCPRIAAGLNGEMFIGFYEGDDAKIIGGSGNAWNQVFMDTDAASGGINWLADLDIAVTSDGYPVLAYVSNEEGGIVYAVVETGVTSWVSEAYDGARLSLALDSLDRPVIAFVGPDSDADLSVAWMF